MSFKEDRFLAGNLANARDMQKNVHYEPVVRETSVATSISYVETHSDLGRITSSQQQSRVATQIRTANSTLSDNHNHVTLTFFGLFHKPWAYKWAWVLLIEVLVSGFLYAFSLSCNMSILKVLYAFTMSMTVPSAMVCMFTEWDITRRATPGIALLVAVVCGGVSASLAGLMNHYLGITAETAGAAALTEEPIKGIMVIVVLLLVERFPCILSGIALGCAIGAGFAVSETFDYSYAYGVGEDPSISVLILRGFLSPLMHMAWTAALAGAMWKARGVSGNWHKVIMSPSVWLVLCGMMLCHAVWNTIGVVNVLVFALWGLLLHYVRLGVSQAIHNNLVSKEVSL